MTEVEAYHDEYGNVIDVHHAQMFAMLCSENESLIKANRNVAFYKARMESYNKTLTAGAVRDLAIARAVEKHNEAVVKQDKIVQKLWARYVRENNLMPVPENLEVM